MKMFRLIFVLCGLLAVSASGAEPIKAVTWNMCWFPGGSPTASDEEKQTHMSRGQLALKEIAPDIFLCQEITSWAALEEVTAHMPGLRPAVVSDFGSPAEDIPPQNIGIATRLPVNSGWAEKWREAAGKRTNYPLPRGFAFAAIELPDGTLLLTYCVHLKSNRKNREDSREDFIAAREESSQLLRGHIAKMQKIYAKAYPRVGVLVGGDFNTSLDDTRFEAERTLRDFREDGFHWGFDGVPYPQRQTIPSKWGSTLPPASFDHFFTLGIEASPARVLSFKGVSDHQPVEILIEPGKPASP